MTSDLTLTSPSVQSACLLHEDKEPLVDLSSSLVYIGERERRYVLRLFSLWPPCFDDLS